MNAEEAKLILQCRRPRGQDDHSPAISEALALISGDAAGMELLRREEILDALIGERFRSVEPPADLRRKILVGARVSRPRPVWQRPAWLAAAAAFAVALPTAVKYWPVSAPVFASVTLSDFRTATTEKLNTGHTNFKPLASLDEVKDHLARNTKSKSSVPVPGNLCHCPGGTVGCEIFEWKGREVTLICFNAGKTGTVHLFTVDASALKDGPGGPIYKPENGWQTRAWIEDGHLMVLAGSERAATEQDLEMLAQTN